MKVSTSTPTGETEVARELIRFVREILGCGCPDEVLARITEDASERAEAGLDVGGRLLVRVLSAQDVDSLIGDFPDTWSDCGMSATAVDSTGCGWS